MLVKEKMTKNPVTISPDDYVSSALDVFDDHDFHCLPVVDKSNHLIGLLTEKTISSNLPSQATSLSIHELNYLLNQTKIVDIMIPNPTTISPDALLEEAADVLLHNNYTCLPVIDDGYVVGIITKNDLFESFIDLQGYYNKGTRVVVLIKEDRPGILRDIATILSADGINITHLVVERLEDTTDLRIVIRVDETDSDKVTSGLKDSFEIIDVKTYK